MEIMCIRIMFLPFCIFWSVSWLPLWRKMVSGFTRNWDCEGEKYFFFFVTKNCELCFYENK